MASSRLPDYGNGGAKSKVVMRQYHDRMPVILGAEDFAAWLDPQNDDPGSLTYLYEPYPAEELAAYLCNPAVNSARHDAPDCLEAAS